jgi:BatD DUF11 like domain
VNMIIHFLRFSFLVPIILLPGLFASGQVKFTTVAGSHQIGKGEYLQVEFVVENAKDIDKFTPPDFSGFHVVQEPAQSSGMSVVNGNVSQYQSLTFLLQPAKTGKFTIEGASAVVDGKKMRSNSITITVTAAATGNKGNNNNPINAFPQLSWPDPVPAITDDIRRESVLRPGEDAREKIRKNLFVKVQVDRSDCYVGESIVATYKLYSRLNSEFRVTKSPSLNGFSLYDMVDPSTEPSSVEKLNGRSYIVRILRKTQLVPLQPGTIDLDPVEVENTVHLIKREGVQGQKRSGDAMQDLFDQLSENSAPGTEVEENAILDTKPLTITIKPLPEKDKPADFNGVVGNFSIASALVNRNVNAQDEADLKVTVKGSGNLFVVNAPPVRWPSGVDVFNPTAKEDINRTKVPLSGSKTFDYIFTTRAPGHYKIPPVGLSYFDPSTRAYKKIQSSPVDFEVMPAAKKTGPSAGLVPAKTEGGGTFKDLVQRHLESLFAILILSCLAFYLWKQNLRLKRIEKAGNKGSAVQVPGTQSGTGGSSGARGPASPGDHSSRADQAEWMIMAFDPLSDIKERLENGDYPGFYRELNRTMWKAVADKLDLPASELNKYNVIRRLEAKGWDAPTTLSLEHLLNECEMNLYTPDYDTYNMQQLLRQAESLLGVLISNTSY